MNLERQHQNSKATDDTQPNQSHAAGRILTTGVRPARAMRAGLCATLVGVGLSRFAYAPLLPEMVRAGWLAGDASPQLWRGCTAAWGAAEAATGFFLAWVFAISGAHAPIFAAGLAAALGAVLALWPTGPRQARRARLDTALRRTY